MNREDYLVEYGVITPEQYQQAMALRQSKPEKDLTDIMLEEGFVTWESLIGLLYHQVSDLR